MGFVLWGLASVLEVRKAVRGHIGRGLWGLALLGLASTLEVRGVLRRPLGVLLGFVL